MRSGRPTNEAKKRRVIVFLIVGFIAVLLLWSFASGNNARKAATERGDVVDLKPIRKVERKKLKSDNIEIPQIDADEKKLDDERADLVKDLVKVEDIVEKMEDELGKGVKQEQALTNELKDVQDHEKDRDVSFSKKHTLEKEEDEIKKDIVQVKETNEQIEQDIVDIVDEEGIVQNQLEDVLEQELEKVIATEDKLNDAADAIEEDEDELDNEIAQVEDEKDEIEEKLVTVEEKLDSVKDPKQQAQLHQLAEELEQELDEADADRSDLEQKLEEKVEQEEKVQKALKKEQDKEDEIANDLEVIENNREEEAEVEIKSSRNKKRNN